MTESACLLRSFSHPSDASREAKEGDYLHALGESISFGRFMSESLAWEKWSTFSHNRYLEEVEKFSKPGSVAQKKAYFEAHYKRKAAQKAAAALEEANTAAMTEIKTEDESSISSHLNSELLRENNQVMATCERKDVVQNAKIVASTEADAHNSMNEEGMVEIAKMEEEIVHQNDYMEISVNIENANRCREVEGDTMIVIPEDEKTTLDLSPAEREIIASGTLRIQQNHSSKLLTHSRSPKPPSSPKQPTSMIVIPEDAKTTPDPAAEREIISSGSLGRQQNHSSKLLTHSRSPKPPSSPKQPTSSQLRIHRSNITPKSTKHAVDIAERLTTKSIHMSINFNSHPKQVGKTSPELPQNGRKRMNRIPLAASKETSIPPKKIANRLQASVNGFLNQPLIKPPSENRRCVKSSNANGSKERSPLICSPFSFRSEERAAKRKEFFRKLEEKANLQESRQKQRQERYQEKVEDSIKNLRQSRSLKAKGHQDSNQESKSPSNHIKKIPVRRPRSPKLGTKPATSMVQTSSLPPRRPSVTSGSSKKNVARKEYQCTGQSVTSLRKKINAHENSSPNIQC